jgi:membrane protein
MNWLDRKVAAADRFQARRPWTAVPVAVWKKGQDDQAGYLAALICYFGFVAIFPMLLIFVTVLDMTLKSNPELHRDLLNSALMQYPVIGEDIGSNLGSISGSGTPLIVGGIVLLLGTRGVAFAMQNALCTVWGITRDKRPSFGWRWLYGITLVLVIGIGLVVTTFLSGIAGGTGDLVTGFGAHVGAAAISLGANVGLFWLAFRLATLRMVSWRSLRFGAMLAAVIWQVLQVTGGYVVSHQLHRASTLYGTFGVVLGLLGWLYLQAMVTLYCAEVDAVLTMRRWPRSLFPDAATAGVSPSPGPSATASAEAGDDDRGETTVTAIPAPVVPTPRPSPGEPLREEPSQEKPAHGEPGRGEAAQEGPRREEAGHDTSAA